MNADRIFTLGAGRSGLIMKAFCMRLVHLGFTAYVVGETVTPSCGKNDLCIIGSGSGETSSILSMVLKAKFVGANIVSISSSCQSSISNISNRTILISYPSFRGCFDDKFVQPMGSFFEGSLFFLTEFVVSKIMEINKIDSKMMLEIHANLE